MRPREVAEQQGTIRTDYAVARQAADDFYARLRELFKQRKPITTFGPYSPGQAVAIKRMGIEGIYLGGWATSAKGSITEDPGPDLASYPLSQVPDEAAALVRALLTADKNQHFARMRMTDEQRKATPVVDYRPFIIADADTGHGGDAHVRNLIRRFVEVGVPGLSHRGPAAGRQEVRPPGRQGARDRRTSRSSDSTPPAFSSTSCALPASSSPARTPRRRRFLENRSDERDQPFILGATNIDLPSYKAGYLAILRTLSELGAADVRGHLLFAVSEAENRAACPRGSTASGSRRSSHETRTRPQHGVGHGSAESILDKLDTKLHGELADGGRHEDVRPGRRRRMAVPDRRRRAFRHDRSRSGRRSRRRRRFYEVTEKAKSMGIHVDWDCELPKTPEGFYQIQGGLDYAIAKSLAVAPFADLLWMETKTADLRGRAEIRRGHPRRLSRTRCSPTTSRPRSTGTRPA